MPFWLVELIETSGSTTGSVVVVVVAGALVVVVVVAGALVVVVAGAVVVVAGALVVVVVGALDVVVVVAPPQSAGRFVTSLVTTSLLFVSVALTVQGTGSRLRLRKAQLVFLSFLLPMTWLPSLAFTTVTLSPVVPVPLTISLCLLASHFASSIARANAVLALAPNSNAVSIRPNKRRHEFLPVLLLCIVMVITCLASKFS